MQIGEWAGSIAVWAVLLNGSEHIGGSTYKRLEYFGILSRELYTESEKLGKQAMSKAKVQLVNVSKKFQSKSIK